MYITHIEPAAYPGGGNTKTVAFFDCELSSEVKIYGLKLVETPDGRRLVYAPSGNGGRRLATFAPALSARITELASAALEGRATANGTHS